MDFKYPSRRTFLQRVGLLGHIAVADAVLSLGNSASAQTYYPILCSWAGSSHVGGGLGQAAPRALDEVRSIMRAIRLEIPMNVYMGGVPNAAATIIGGSPAIVYNPEFMTGLNYCDPVAAQSVLAHEVGHHANRDTTWSARFRHPWQRELGADWVSGLAMKRLGVSLQRAVNGILCSFGPFSPGSPSHPDSQRRLQAVQDGWYFG